jgi:hypothetical protein
MSSCDGEPLKVKSPVGSLRVHARSDRNLLFGLLALQTGLVTHGALFATFNAWTRDKARSKATILIDHGDLDAARLGVLEALVAVYGSRRPRRPTGPRRAARARSPGDSRKAKPGQLAHL